MPSPHHDADTRRAAIWVRDDLAAMGLKTELIETKGHPIVYAEWLVGTGKADTAHLRALRRPARRTPRAVALPPIRAHRPKRQSLRPRRHRR